MKVLSRGASCVKQRLPPPVNSRRESSVFASVWFKCSVPGDGGHRWLGKVTVLTECSLCDVPHTPRRAGVNGPRGDGAPWSQASGCFPLSNLFPLLPPPPLLGRTGLLADLLPSFAVEIMPGIQSFNSLFAYSAVICLASALVTNCSFHLVAHLSVYVCGLFQEELSPLEEAFNCTSSVIRPLKEKR